ncbi:MAG: BrnA antitoxin family protein [Rhodothermales bacterium]
MNKRIPEFESEDQERDFWAEHDATDYVEWSGGHRMLFHALKPTTTSITLRLPEHLLFHLKALAHKRDVPYQSLLKLYLAERVEAELKKEEESRPR